MADLLLQELSCNLFLSFNVKIYFFNNHTYVFMFTIP